MSEKRRVRLGGVGLGVGEGWFVVVASSFAVAAAGDDDDGEAEDDVVVPMRKRYVCGIMA